MVGIANILKEKNIVYYYGSSHNVDYQVIHLLNTHLLEYEKDPIVAIID